MRVNVRTSRTVAVTKPIRFESGVYFSCSTMRGLYLSPDRMPSHACVHMVESKGYGHAKTGNDPTATRCDCFTSSWFQRCFQPAGSDYSATGAGYIFMAGSPHEYWNLVRYVIRKLAHSAQTEWLPSQGPQSVYRKCSAHFRLFQ